MSVLENIDGSPESIILESVLEGMSEYYSRNLAREVQKEKKKLRINVCITAASLPSATRSMNPENIT